MFFLSWLKQLKKKLRLKRRWLALGLLILLVGLSSVWTLGGRTGMWNGWNDSSGNERSVFQHQTEPVSKELEKQLAKISKSNHPIETYVKKTYVCGEELQSMGKLEPKDIVQLIQSVSASQVVDVSIEETGSVYVTEDIDDLSPACKENAYFGLDSSGNLSLFDGLPDKDKVIRTFFQLNISHLESSLPHDTVKQLYRGIRVTDLAGYNSVISTLSDFAVEESEKAMSMPQQ
jgi:forespore regulator of the sigma-K checkpoint